MHTQVHRFSKGGSFIPPLLGEIRRKENREIPNTIVRECGDEAWVKI
jgi:hypothetical protein